MQAHKELSGQRRTGGEGRVGGSTASSPSWSGEEMEMPTCCLQFERHLLAQDDRKNTITMQCNAKSQHKSLTSSNRLAMAHFQPLYVIVTILFITRWHHRCLHGVYGVHKHGCLNSNMDDMGCVKRNYQHYRCVNASRNGNLQIPLQWSLNHWWYIAKYNC